MPLTHFISGFLLSLFVFNTLYAEPTPSFLREHFKIMLSATHEGPLQLHVKEGAFVKKGARLFEVDTTELAFNVEVKQLEWEQAKIQLERVKNALTEKELELEEALFAQEQLLYDSGGMADEAFRIKELQHELEIQDARPEEVAVAELDVKLSEIQLDLAKKALSKAIVTAPSEGKVNQLLARSNEWVQPGHNVMELMGIHPLDIVVNVPLEQANQLKLNTPLPVVVFSGGAEQKIQGTIKYISDEVDPVSQTLRIRLEISNAKHQFKPGMRVQVLLP